MQEHRDEVFKVAKVLSYLTTQINPDGIEVTFTSNPKQKFTCPTGSEVESCLRKYFSQELDVDCQMEDTLDTVFRDIKTKWLPTPLSRAPLSRLTRPKVSAVSMYILTNGVWGQSEEGICGVEKPIENLATHMRTYQIGRTEAAIQFVRFGSDTRGIRRLESLENEMCRNGATMDL